MTTIQELVWSSYIPCPQSWHFCVTYVEGFVKQTLFTCWTVWYDWYPVIFCESWRVPHVGQEMLTLSGTPDSLSLGISRLHPFIVYTLQHLSVLGLRLRINDSGLFAWNSSDCLVSDLFYWSHIDCSQFECEECFKHIFTRAFIRHIFTKYHYDPDYDTSSVPVWILNCNWNCNWNLVYNVIVL